MKPWSASYNRRYEREGTVLLLLELIFTACFHAQTSRKKQTATTHHYAVPTFGSVDKNHSLVLFV